MKAIFWASIIVFTGGLAPAQDNSPDRVTVPFSDPNRPHIVKCSLLNGSIHATGYSGKDVIVEARGEGHQRRHEERSDGLRRIYPSGSGLTVEESENVIKVGTGTMSGNADIVMQVPYNTSLKLHAVNGGDIVVDHVTGDVEIDNTNGNALATHLTGSAILHALNGKVLASFDHVTPDKAISFSSLNGDIDVTLPADIKARVKLKSDNGEVYSDFDIRLETTGRQPTVEDNRSGGNGRYRVRVDKAIFGTINGGGPEMRATTFNGNVYIRKTK